MEMSNSKKFQNESQQQRWIKYGSNVALAVVVVVVLAGLLVYLAQRFDKRVDTTTAGLYSLKPQTVQILKDVKQKIKLVSLYQAKDAAGRPNASAGMVNDLLQEYASKGTGVDFEIVDPITQPGKTDEIVTEAINRYGGATKAYANYVTDFNKAADQLKQQLSDESAAVNEFSQQKFGEDDRGQTITVIVSTIRDLPTTLTTLQDRISRALKVKHPDYKKIVDSISDSLDRIGQTEDAIGKVAAQYKNETVVPEAFRKYLSDSEPRHAAIKKLIDDTIAKSKNLGELKTGELQNAIKNQDIVLVMGENDYRVVDNSQIFVTDSRDLRQYNEGESLKPRFAGEQAITTAILAVSSPTKPKVVFIRPGGRPLASPGMPPFVPGGPFGDLAERLKSYNFEVLEKDISGSYAMQAQMSGQQAEPEPSDEEIKDAVWIVLDVPNQQQQQMPGMGGSIGPKLAQHLKDGGSAMVLAIRNGDPLAESLKDYGIELMPDTVAVHQAQSTDRANGQDVAEDVQRLPYVFVVNKYASSLITNALQSLDSLLAVPIVVKTSAVQGVTNQALLQIPEAGQGQVWGEKNADSIGSGGAKLQYDPGTDVPGPLYTGSMAEKGKSRLVVYGILQSFTNDVLSLPDEGLLRTKRVVVARFPGNAELFANSVFWLAKMEPMIAISPAAMQVSRIAPMTDSTLATWRIGVLLVLLPGLVVLSGVMVYFARRD